jgi:hypothetical protein
MAKSGKNLQENGSRTLSVIKGRAMRSGQVPAKAGFEKINRSLACIFVFFRIEPRADADCGGTQRGKAGSDRREVRPGAGQAVAPTEAVRAGFPAASRLGGAPGAGKDMIIFMPPACQGGWDIRRVSLKINKKTSTSVNWLSVKRLRWKTGGGAGFFFSRKARETGEKRKWKRQGKVNRKPKDGDF